MTEKNYVITRTEISLDSGAKIIADVSSLDDIKKLLTDIRTAGMGEPIAETQATDSVNKAKNSPATQIDDPTQRIETQVGLEAGRLATAKILAIKNGIPQFIQKSLFPSVTDAILVLLYALEVGLRQNPIQYETFVSIFDAQNLKSGSPLSMLMTNLRKATYLDSRAYADGRKLRLTAKGDAKAVEVLKKIATRSGG